VKEGEERKKVELHRGTGDEMAPKLSELRDF
jgi:hypothetical protein